MNAIPLLAVAGVLALGMSPLPARTPADKIPEHPSYITVEGRQAVAGRLIVKLRNEALSVGAMNALGNRKLRLTRSFERVKGLMLCQMDAADGTDRNQSAKARLLETIERLRASGEFEYVEPDWVVTTQEVPSDVALSDGRLWGLNNYGQSGGTSGIDVRALQAWEVTTGDPEVVVAVIDTGVRYTHQDLAANMWENPGEVAGNGVDDDANGYVDDVYGISALNLSGDPWDDEGHGTHVAGTIAAVGNNSGAHVGVAFNAKIMALKFLDSSGVGSTSGAIRCIEYAIQEGADVMNNSWGGGGFSQALFDVIEEANEAGILFVAAAGNSGTNNDFSPHYPSSYDVANVVSVAAIDRSGNLASFSNYGSDSVDLAAPGVFIYSCEHGSDSDYGYQSGTSMATPHVSGVAALLKSAYPGMSALDLANRLIVSAEPLAQLTGDVRSGGMVDAAEALNLSPDGELEIGISTPDGLRAGELATIRISVSDAELLTNATVMANFEGETVETFFDNGSGVDDVANDGRYSAQLRVPSDSGRTIILEVTASVPGKSPANRSMVLAVVSQPANDHFEDRTVLVAGSTSATGSNELATLEPGETRNPPVAGGRTVWYEWRAPGSGYYSITTFGSGYDTTLAVYAGDVLPGLTLVGSNDDTGGLQSSVTFYATEGQAYQLQVDGWAGSQGNIELNFPSPAGDGAPTIVTHPKSQAVFVGDPLQLTVEALGAAPLQYAWYQDGVLLLGQSSNTLSINNVDTGDAGIYRVLVSNAAGEVETNPALITVEQGPGDRTEPNDDFADREPIIAESGVQEIRTANTNEATPEFNEPDATQVADPKESLWWSFTPTRDGSVAIDTQGSDFDTTLAVYVGSTLASLATVVHNDDAIGTLSYVAFPVIAGTEYQIQADGFYNRSGNLQLNLLYTSVNEPPEAVLPADLTVFDVDYDGLVSISVDGTGSSDPEDALTSFLWTLDEEALNFAGETLLVDLPLGEHEIGLTVVDDVGQASEDTMTVSVVITDVDGDGLPDPFEYKIISSNPDDAFVSLTDIDPEGDFDADGDTNRFEYLTGNDPVDPKSHVVLQLVPVSELVFGPVNFNRSYEVHYSLGLHSGRWNAFPGTEFIVDGDHYRVVLPDINFVSDFEAESIDSIFLRVQVTP